MHTVYVQGVFYYHTDFLVLKLWAQQMWHSCRGIPLFWNSTNLEAVTFYSTLISYKSWKLHLIQDIHHWISLVNRGNIGTECAGSAEKKVPLPHQMETPPTTGSRKSETTSWPVIVAADTTHFAWQACASVCRVRLSFKLCPTLLDRALPPDVEQDAPSFDCTQLSAIMNISK